MKVSVCSFLVAFGTFQNAPDLHPSSEVQGPDPTPHQQQHSITFAIANASLVPASNYCSLFHPAFHAAFMGNRFI